MKTRARWLGMGAMACIAGCGSTAGEAARPADPTFVGAARGGPAPVCHEVTDEGTPLIVDWNPEERGDLEVAMKQGVAVVHYDCTSIKVLPDCHVEGAYGFLGTTKKEQIITLDNADQAQANLPLNGAKLGASLSRGSTLDIGLVMIGKKATTIVNVGRALLTGRCEGATHFVQSATVGAFAMKTSTAGEVKAVAEVFSFGGSAGSTSTKSVNTKDGDIAACQGADVDGVKAPNGCGALLRVRLLGLTTGDAAPRDEKKDPPKELACAAGLEVVKGKCTAPAANTAVCDLSSDTAVCVKRCDGGEADACSLLSLKYTLGMDVPQSDAKSAELTARGCTLGDLQACKFQGDAEMWKDLAKAEKLYVKACNGGNSAGCEDLAQRFMPGAVGKVFPPDAAKSMKYAQRGCDAGSGRSCAIVAHATADKAKAQRLLRFACDGNDAAACVEVGAAYEKGDGYPANPAKARALYKRACGFSVKEGCDHLKKLGG